MAKQNDLVTSGPAIHGRAFTRPRGDASQAGGFTLRRQAD